jgi:hypothetical protein
LWEIKQVTGSRKKKKYRKHPAYRSLLLSSFNERWWIKLLWIGFHWIYSEERDNI